MKIFRGLILLTLFSFTGLISASGQGFKAGLVAGISATQISGDQLGGFDKAGIAAGGFVSTYISPRFDAQMEILYFQKGSKKNANPDKEDYTYYRLRLNYFEVPLLLQWKYSKRFIFEIGPTFGALLSSQEEDEYGELNQTFPFRKFELGGLGGLNVMIAKGFSFNARMETSILPVREHVSGQSYRLNHGQYNGCIALTLRYKFEGKQKPVE